MTMLATPALADVTIGMWSSPDNEIQISFHGMGFTQYLPDQDIFIRCEIVEWPISSPEATVECENGETHMVAIGQGRVVFDGVELVNTPDGLD